MPFGETLTRALAVIRPPAPRLPAVQPQADASAAPPMVVRRLMPARLDAAPLSARRARRGPGRWLGFFAVVALPTALAALYLFAVAADQYVAEFRFTLSSAERIRPDPISFLVGTAAHAPAALESQVLVQYIGSRAIVDRVNATIDLRRLFAPPQADWWSRVAKPAPIEELVRYWKGQVDPFYDPANGTVTVRVRAFAPADALRLAQAIVAASEQLVNDLSQRARQDALRQAEAQVTMTERRLQSVLGEIRKFRDQEGLIDPARSAAGAGRLSDRLHDELVQDRARLATLETYMRADAPPVKLLKTRIRSLEAQRRRLGHEMTGGDDAAAKPLSRLLGSYEQLDSERRFAEAAYQHALAGLDEARANADRQHVFVANFIPPSLPEEALYPRRWRSLGTVALLAFALWGIGALGLQSIRDHLT